MRWDGSPESAVRLVHGATPRRPRAGSAHGLACQASTSRKSHGGRRTAFPGMHASRKWSPRQTCQCPLRAS
eukprot:scaffold104707_cov33-Tisochrysis_lutea.AAC.4